MIRSRTYKRRQRWAMDLPNIALLEGDIGIFRSFNLRDEASKAHTRCLMIQDYSMMYDTKDKSICDLGPFSGQAIYLGIS